jgi:beta-glucanase (GH16 family)
MKVLKAMMMACSLCLLATSMTQAQNWQLVWQDEFTNGIGPDWVFEIGNGASGWGNNELQYYRSQNASVQNGQLVITARQENYGGYNYTSARMKTQGLRSFQYGRIEARIALPSGQGLWPAFWMLGNNINAIGWPACGEIDIMEHVNSSPDIHGTIHWQDNNGNYASYGGNTATNVGAYHVYAIEWDQNEIRWYLDGQQYHTVNISNGINGTSEFHNDFFILLNMAVGGNWPGFSVDNGALPASMLVDYVRVYQDAGSNPSFSQFIEAENYNSMNGVQLEGTSDAGGGQNVGWIDAGDWMAYNSINVPRSGNYTIQYRVASPNGGQLSMDLNAGSTVLGNVGIPATGGWQNWTTVSQTVYINAGTYNFGIFAQTGGWNINWWQIIEQGNTSSRSASEETTANSNSENAEIGFALFPNPAQNALTIQTGDETLSKFRIINANGKILLQGKIQQGELDISTLKQGIYTIQIGEGDALISRRFIKE